MELMDSSLDKFYHFIFDDLQQTLPEAVIGEKSGNEMKYSNIFFFFFFSEMGITLISAIENIDPNLTTFQARSL